MSEQKKTLKEEILELSSKITASLKTDEKAGVIESSSDTYFENLPEGLTPELIKAKSDYDSNYIAAGSHAVGEAGLKILAANKELDKVTGTAAMGYKDSLNVTVYRQKEYPKPGSAGEKIVKKGAMSISFDTRATNNSGQLAIAKSTILEAAADLI